MTDKQKIYNTRRLQIMVLCGYMNDEQDSLYCGSGFTNSDGKYIPFKKAVEMYNNESKDIRSRYAFDKLKLSYDKRKKKIICLSNVIKTLELIDSEEDYNHFLKILKRHK